MSILSIILFGGLAAAAVAGVALGKRSYLWTAVTIGAVTLLIPALAATGENATFLPTLDAVGTIFGVMAIALAVSGVASYLFRGLLIAISPPGLARELRTAPLTAAFGLLIIFFVIILMIFAPFIAPYGETASVGDQFVAPNSEFWMGTDRAGRDVFSRLIYGARNSVGIALMATAIAFIAGALAGLFAAIRGGWMDQLIGRVSDIMMSMPSLIFALLMLSIFGTDTWVVIVVVATVYAPRVFRLTRAVAGNVAVMDYVEAARLRGESSWYLMQREILPNAKSPLIAEFGLEFCFVFLLISGLAFLGIGLQPPAAHWGSMVKDLATRYRDLPQPYFVAGAIALLTVSVNFVVDWMLHRSSGLKD